MHGARVIALQGNFDDALRIVPLCQNHPIELVNSVNPYRIEGQKTGAFEVVEDLGQAPGALAIPVGNAGNVTAYWRGFQESARRRCSTGFRPTAPRRWSPASRSPTETWPRRSGSATRPAGRRRWPPSPVARPRRRGLRRADLDAYPGSPPPKASSASPPRPPGSPAYPPGLPAVEATSQPETVVAVLTGHGLKDPDTALGKAPAVINCENDLSAVERVVF